MSALLQHVIFLSNYCAMCEMFDPFLKSRSRTIPTVFMVYTLYTCLPPITGPLPHMFLSFVQKVDLLGFRCNPYPASHILVASSSFCISYRDLVISLVSSANSSELSWAFPYQQSSIISCVSKHHSSGKRLYITGEELAPCLSPFYSS